MNAHVKAISELLTKVDPAIAAEIETELLEFQNQLKELAEDWQMKPETRFNYDSQAEYAQGKQSCSDDLNSLIS